MDRILTFLPGTMCDQRLWGPVWQRLNPRFSCDYVATETEKTREGMLGLIHSAASVGAPLHLVAFSMGGYLAFEYALANPGRVASLVTVASSAFGLTDQEKGRPDPLPAHAGEARLSGDAACPAQPVRPSHPPE